MEINLLLTAKPLRLAPQLNLGGEAGGVLTVKNISERTYLQVTSRQWRVLQFFRETQTVPHLLETLLDQRLCPALGELYELVLKAVRARILVEPGHVPAAMPAVNWGFTLRPAKLRHALGTLLALGLGLT
ncbi:MAG TPA: hypothetical protein PKY38_10470, partial [Opitutaceae bacterium]|nr:hypothetical protein [Opitutaceae bacterium]